MAETRSIHVLISGRVQGVGFRAWAADRAEALRLSGWVRNTADGDVEAVFSGPTEAVDAILAACKEGPRHAAVSRLEILRPVGEVSGRFAVRS